MATRMNTAQVLELIEKHDLRYFAVMDGNKTIFLQDSNISLDESMKMLEDFLSKLDGDTTTVKAYNIPRKKKAAGGNWLEFEWSVMLPGYTPRGQKSVGSVQEPGWMEKYYDLRMEMIQRDNQRALEDLRREKSGGALGVIGEISTALKEHNVSPLEAIAMVGSVIRGLMTPQIAPTTALAGPSPEIAEPTIDEQKTEYRNRLNAAIKRLAVIDDNLPMFLERVADSAEKDRDTYFMYRKMIMGE